MNDEYKKVSFRISKEIYDKICLIASSDYLSLSAYIRKELEKSLDSNIIKDEEIRRCEY